MGRRGFTHRRDPDRGRDHPEEPRRPFPRALLAICRSTDLGAVEEHDVLRFRLTGVELSGFQLDGGRQTLSGDTLTVRREDWDAVEPGFSLPYKLMDFHETLAAEPLIQSDDPRIQDEDRR